MGTTRAKSIRSVELAPAPSFEIKPPFPYGDPRWGELEFLLYGGPDNRLYRWKNEDGTRCRRAGTYFSPLAFAYVYLAPTLRPVRPLLLDNTPDLSVAPAVSFSDFHLAMCEEAKYWMTPGARRVGLIAPRGAGKSVWTFKILPLWALAHGHRSFFFGYAHSDDMAVKMLNSLRYQLQNNELLLLDFPELAIPKGGRNNNHLVETASGATFATGGIDKVSLGARSVTDVRPDLSVVDDGEPNEGNYATDGKVKRLDTIRDIILPMNPEAVILMSGTVVMPESIGHDLVKKALGEPTESWVDEEEFRASYFNAIQDEGTSNERSLWPEKWSLDWLHKFRGKNPAKYALHYANQPTTRGGLYWQAEHFRYEPHFPIEHYIMYVDPAEVAKEGRDKTAVIVVGTDASRYRAVVLGAFQGHLPDSELGRKIAEYKLGHPEIPLLHVYVEGYNSGELRRRTLQPLMPHGVRLRMDRPKPAVSITTPGERGKRARIESAFAYYESTVYQVWHQRPFPELEALLTSYPKVRNDDLPDSLSGALRMAFRELPHS